MAGSTKSHHSDDQSGWFFMRHEIRAESLPFGIEAFREAFAPIAEEFSMTGASPTPSRRSAWC
jgi:formyltetrahydrofolate hydrolase